jgi:hypothetical protein
MKTKKEYMILMVIIIAGWSYLFFHKGDRTEYELPVIPKIDINTVTDLEISANGKRIALSKQGEKWLIAPKSYPADGAKIKSMLFEIEDIEITDLVSESKAYARYQLDDENKITIKAWAKDKPLREFDVGKEAATFQHTFFRLPGNSNVYHARGDFRRKFDLGATELRDREVLAFDPDTLKSIRLTAGSDSLEMIRIGTPPGDKQEATKEGDMPTGPSKTAWFSAEGQEVDGKALDSFLASINNLMCENYLEGMQKNQFESPIFDISLEGKQMHTLSIFKKVVEEDTKVPAISSLNAYPFTLSVDKLDNLKKMVAKLIGQKETSKE